MQNNQSANFLKSTWPNYGLTILICSFITVLANGLLGLVDLANIVMLFLLSVFLISVYLGRNAGILAAFLSVALFDFFCVPPRFSFAVSHFQYLITFAVMLAVALITGQLAANLRLQAALAIAREQRTQGLYEMARALSGTLKLNQVCETTATFLREITGLQSVLLLPNDENQLVLTTSNQVWYEPHMAWAAYEGKQARMLSEPDGVYYLPLKGATRMRGVLVLGAVEASPQAAQALSEDNKGLLLAVASLVAIAVERLHYVEVASISEMQTTTERLRSSILSALSHDLRTPLTVLVGMADSLAVSKPALTIKQQDIAQTLRNQSLQLSSMVANLLDMARLHAGKINMQKEWQPLEEVIGASIKMLGQFLAGHNIRVKLPEDLPLLNFDAVLMERVFCNLLENAAKYSPASSIIQISASVQGELVKVSVSDQGCGIPDDKLGLIFNLFERGNATEVANKVAGTGIGLAICKAIVEAHQGNIQAENQPQGGVCISFSLPLGTPPFLNEALFASEPV